MRELVSMGTSCRGACIKWHTVTSPATRTLHLLVLRWPHSELVASMTLGLRVGKLPRSGMSCLWNMKRPTRCRRQHGPPVGSAEWPDGHPRG